MCPICLGNLALLAAGASSGGGLTAFALAKFFKKSKPTQRNKMKTKKLNREIVSKAGDRTERREG